MDKTLKTYFSDIVYLCTTKESSKCQVSILIEHKSQVDKSVSVQILNYIAKVLQEQVKNKKSLMPVIPILYYHGKVKWKLQSIRELMSDYSEAFLEYVPEHKQEFINIRSKDEMEILQVEHTLLRSMLLLQKAIGFEHEEKRIFTQVFSSFEKIKNRNYLLSFFVYLLSSSEMDADTILNEISKLDTEIKNEIMTTYDQIIEKGIEKGLEKGIKKGIEKGIKKGIEKGIEKGINKGDKLRMIKTIIKGFENGADISFLAKINDISEQEVIDILKNNELM